MSAVGRARLTTLAATTAVASAALLALKQIADTDVWFHLAYGREVLARGAFPPAAAFVDPVGRATGELRIPEWLYGVALRLFETAFGLPGVNLLVCLLAAATFYVLWRDRPREQSSPSAAAWLTSAILVLAAVLMRERLQPRPELAGFLLAAAVHAAIHRHEEGDERAVLSVPLLFVVWANVHPSEIVGLGLLGLHTLASAAVVGVAAVRRRPSPVGARRRAAVAAGVTAGAFAATFVSATPGQGTRAAWLFFLSMVRAAPPGAALAGPAAGGPGLVHFVAEVAPPGREDLLGLHGGFLALVVLSFALAFWARRFAPGDLLRATAACAVSLVAARLIPLAPLLCAPIVARNLAAFAASRPRRAVVAAVPLLALVPLAAAQLGRFADERVGVGRLAGRFPEAGLEFLLRHQVTGPLYATIHFGGYVEWRAAPSLRPLHDSTSADSVLGRDGLLAPFDAGAFGRLHTRFGFRAALVETPRLADERALRQLAGRERDLGFPDPEWALVHFDDAASVYVERGGPLAAVAASAEYLCARPANGLEALALKLTDPGAAPGCRAELRRAIGESPAGALARLMLARALIDGGEPGAAEAELRLAERAALGPLRTEVAVERARVAWLEGRAAATCAGLATALRDEPAGWSRAAVLAGAACLASHPENPRRAARFFEQAIRADVEVAGGYAGLARCPPRAESGKDPSYYAQWLAAHRGRFESDPDVRAAAPLLRERQYAAASRHLAQAVARNPRNVLAAANLGMSLLEQGHASEAATALSRALALDPFYAEAEYGLALVLERQGRKPLAAARLRRFLALQPDGPWAERARARLAALGAPVQP